MSKVLRFFAILAGFSALSACGGGGSSSGDRDNSSSGSEVATKNAQGLWTGTTDLGEWLFGFVLSDTRYFFMYSEVGGGDIAGVIIGRAEEYGDKFLSPDARYHQFGDEVLPGHVTATFTHKQNITGSFTYVAGGETGFTTGYDPSWEDEPTISAIEGAWEGQAETNVGSESASFTISGDGSINAQVEGGCTWTGSITPRTDGDVFDLTILVASSELCAMEYRGIEITGVLVFNGIEIFAMGEDSTRDYGAFFIGKKQL